MALPVGIREFVLLCMPAVGRWSVVLGVWEAVYPRVTGLGASFIRNCSLVDVLIASLVLSFSLTAVFGPIIAVTLLCAGSLLVRSYVWWISGKIGGITGDVLGSINEGSEILCAPMLVVLM